MTGAVAGGDDDRVSIFALIIRRALLGRKRILKLWTSTGDECYFLGGTETPKEQEFKRRHIGKRVVRACLFDLFIAIPP